MNEKVERMNRYFENQITACKRQETALREDARIDEANFQKIRANVYDIFRTILSVAQRSGNGDPEAVRQFFLVKTEKIPANWKTAYDAAKQHDDAERMMIEAIKLDTVQEIRDEFLTDWEKIR